MDDERLSYSTIGSTSLFPWNLLLFTSSEIISSCCLGKVIRIIEKKEWKSLYYYDNI